MPDQPQIPNIKLGDQGLPPVIPRTDPPVPPPAEASSPPAEPVPLPKVTDVVVVKPETVTAPQTQMPPAPAAAAKAEEPHPLFEKPVIVTPEQKEEGKRQKEEGSGHKLPKGIIAGIAALVFLVVGLGSGLYLVKQRGIGEIRKSATSGCNIVDTDQGPGCWCANGGWQFHCGGGLTRGSPASDQCRERCGNLNAGGPQPTNPPPQPPPGQGCQENINDDCGNAGQGFCTVCVDGRAEYRCWPPAVGVGGGCVSPSGGGNECDANRQCPSGQVCQGAEGSRRCQVQSPGDQTSCGNNFSAFQCQRLTDYGTGRGECRENRADFNSANSNDPEGAARRYANAWGCGQVDQVNASGQLCGSFAIFSEGCEGVRPTETPGPQATSTPAPPGEQPTATPTPVTISANCQSLLGQISDGAGGWITKTDSEFSAAARPGDRVRFVCTGAKTRGGFTKSAFFINNILHVDDVVKLNDTQFAVEYTIPAAGALTVGSVLLHDSKGWVD